MARRASRSTRPKSPVAEPPAEKSGGGVAALLDRIRWDWLALGISLVLLAWLVTEGDWEFFPKAGFLESFYDAQAQSLVHGRIDVPPEAIGTEAFMRDGKAYGYFGPTPALMRLPLELLLPGMYGRWGRMSMLLGSALTLGMLLLLMNRLESRFPLPAAPRLRLLLRGVLILAAAIGSTNFFVSTEHKMYQESILWGSALAFAQAVFLVCYLTGPKANGWRSVVWRPCWHSWRECRRERGRSSRCWFWTWRCWYRLPASAVFSPCRLCRGARPSR